MLRRSRSPPSPFALGRTNQGISTSVKFRHLFANLRARYLHSLDTADHIDGGILRRLFLFVFLLSTASSFAQYTDIQAFKDLGGAPEFARRRSDLAKQLKSGYTLLWARINEPEAAPYREDNDFYYFTGVQDLGAILLMNNQTGETTLFEAQQA